MLNEECDLDEIYEYLTRLLKEESFSARYSTDDEKDEKSKSLEMVEKRAKELIKQCTAFTGEIKKLLVTMRTIHESKIDC